MGASGMTVEELEDKIRYLMSEMSVAYLRIHRLEAQVKSLQLAAPRGIEAGEAPSATPASQSERSDP